MHVVVCLSADVTDYDGSNGTIASCIFINIIDRVDIKVDAPVSVGSIYEHDLSVCFLYSFHYAPGLFYSPPFRPLGSW